MKINPHHPLIVSVNSVKQSNKIIFFFLAKDIEGMKSRQNSIIGGITNGGPAPIGDLTSSEGPSFMPVSQH
jgi:hypothetical protein